jgi:cyclophilin family peptidyl-prolyl cis-trans isomerase
MTCTLFPDKAPNAVANFTGLATGTRDWHDPKTNKKQHGVPLYNGTIFHRVIPNFMVQGGDPLGNGTGGPGYEIKDELSPDLKFDVPGRLAYANSGPNTNGSQFFITEVPTPFLDACLDAGGCDRGGRHMEPNTGYVIFGQCDNATVDLVKQIARRARDERNDLPYDPVKINSITIAGTKNAGAPHRRKKSSAAPAGVKKTVPSPKT